MDTQKKVRQALKKAEQLEKVIKEIIRDTDDYDMARLLKKVDAQCMDAQHNLALVGRLSEATGRKKKDTGKPKKKSQ